jgi:CubicO group peptidase (beta-lactamase class C family)
MSSFDSALARLITEATVPGAAAAIIRNGAVERYVCHGARTAQASDTVDEDTVFEAASLSKPVFAHAVLQLADQGYLSLETPLSTYLPDYVPADPRASSITASHVLGHCAGLPNWRNADVPLKTHFPPGERFSYSGEGFLYLQKAIEAITGEKIHTLIDQLVLEPLAMTRSSFVWDPRFDHNRAYPHDPFGRPALSFKPGEANAAWSLQTSGADFARFLLAVLGGVRLKPETAQLWLQPYVEIKHRGIQCLGLGARWEDVFSLG